MSLRFIKLGYSSNITSNLLFVSGRWTLGSLVWLKRLTGNVGKPDSFFEGNLSSSALLTDTLRLTDLLRFLLFLIMSSNSADLCLRGCSLPCLTLIYTWMSDCFFRIQGTASSSGVSCLSLLRRLFMIFMPFLFMRKLVGALKRSLFFDNILPSVCSTIDWLLFYLN